MGDVDSQILGGSKVQHMGTTLLRIAGSLLDRERFNDLPSVTQLPGLCRRGERQGAAPFAPLPPVAFPDLESVYLQDSLRSGLSLDDSLLAFSSSGLSPEGWPSPEEPPISVAEPQISKPGEQQLGDPGPEGGAGLQGSLLLVDCSPPFEEEEEDEEEVFYN